MTLENTQSATPNSTIPIPTYVHLDGNFSPISRPTKPVTVNVRELVIGTASDMSD